MYLIGIGQVILRKMLSQDQLVSQARNFGLIRKRVLLYVWLKIRKQENMKMFMKNLDWLLTTIFQTPFLRANFFLSLLEGDEK